MVPRPPTSTAILDSERSQVKEDVPFKTQSFRDFGVKKNLCVHSTTRIGSELKVLQKLLSGSSWKLMQPGRSSVTRTLGDSMTCRGEVRVIVSSLIQKGS